MSTIAQIPKHQVNYQTITFGPWPHGVNTVKPAFEIQPTELSYCLNFMPLKEGQWKTRPAVVKYSNSATTSNSAVKCLAICPISSNNYELLIDDNNVLYYYDSSLNPVEIKSTLEGEGSIQPFAGTAMIFDTSYIKFCDLTNITAATKANPCVITYIGQDLRNGQSITINGIDGMTELNGNSYIIASLDSDAKTFQLTGTDSSTYTTYTSGGVCSMLAIAYDKGTGISGYQFDNHTGDDDTTIALGNGTNVRVAWKFTSQSWDAGYTIPVVTVTAKLKREGNGFTGTDNINIWCRLRKVSDNAVIAEKVFVEAPLASNVSIAADEYSVTFNSDDILNEMDPSITYYLSLEYNNGDTTNYIHVCCTTVSSGGAGYHYTTAWAADGTENPVMSLRPGRPPRGSWGIVNDNHLIVYDPDNPGKAVFSGPSDFQDWSTSTLAGYVGAVDGNANNFAIGAMADQYGDAFFFGTKEQPYLAKLKGSSPADWSIDRMFQKVSSTHKTCLSVVNDVWYGSRDGVDGLSGVQEYGDLRTFFASDPIYDRIEANWDEDTTIAGYYPADGQYFLYMAGDHRIQVAHTKIPSSMGGASGTAYSRYPWTEYELYRDIFTDNSLYGFVISDSGENEYRLFKWDKQDLDDDYTETDPESNLTVADDKIIFDNVDYATGCWVNRIFAVDYFDVSFKHKFQFKVTNCDNDCMLGIWSVANHNGSINAIASNNFSCLSLVIGRTDNKYVLQLIEIDDGTIHSVNAIISENTNYYITMVRNENVGTYGALYCFIYSDSDRDTLLGTLSITLHTSKKDFRVLYALHAVEGATGISVSGEVSKLSIESNPNFDAQPDFILKDKDKIEEGAAGLLADHEWDYGDNDSLGHNTVYFRDNSGDPDTTGISLHSVLAPTMFANYNNLFFIGGSDGCIYRFDTTECKDQGLHDIIFILQSYCLSVPFTHIRLARIYLSIVSKNGLSPVSEAINMNFNTLSVTFRNVVIGNNNPLFINGASYKCKVLSV